MSVAAVIFDWGGTLTPWHTVDLRTQWASTFARHARGVDATAQDDITQALLDAEKHCWTTSVLEHTSLQLNQLLAQAAAALGMPVADLDTPAARAAYREFWEPHTFTDAAVRPLWTWLHEHQIKVGVLSNTIWSREFHRGVFERDGVLDLIDGDVYSSEIEWVKPAPQAFWAAAEAVGVEPAECVYVGDRLYEDVHGPQQAGMRAIHLPNPALPHDQRVETQAVPDAVAHELVQVAGIVRGWQGIN